MDPEAVRRHFPLFDDADGRPVAYLDNACTTLKPRSVIDAVSEYYTDFPVCGERSAHRLGARVTRAVDASRQRLADHFAVKGRDVAFTKNATEAINLVAYAMSWRRGDVVLTSDKEHNSNFVPWLRVAKAKGVDHRVVRTHEDGTFDRDAFARAVEEAGDRLRLSSFVHVSNADGVEFPIGEIARRTHAAGGLVLVDAAQSAAHQRLRLAELGADLMAVSIHKMMGPAGVGALVANDVAWDSLEAFQLGGGTVEESSVDGYRLLDRPDRFEAGLGNYAGLVAVASALDFLDEVGYDAIQANDARLNARATDSLGEIEGVTVLGPDAARRSSILSFTVDGLHPADVAAYLDDAHDVAVRSGNHCVNSYFRRRGLTGSVRASFHAYNTDEDAQRLVDGVAGLRAAAPSAPQPAGA